MFYLSLLLGLFSEPSVHQSIWFLCLFLDFYDHFVYYSLNFLSYKALSAPVMETIYHLLQSYTLDATQEWHYIIISDVIDLVCNQR